MNQVTKIEAVKPCIEVEVRGKSHTGKSTVAGVIKKALAEAFPGHEVTLTTTDGGRAVDLSEISGEDLQKRLKDVEVIQVLDIDNYNTKS